MKRRKVEKRVEAWAVVLGNGERYGRHPYGVKADAEAAAARTSDGRLVHLAEANPDAEAKARDAARVVKAAIAWARVHGGAASLAEDLMANDLRAAVERYEKKHGSKK